MANDNKYGRLYPERAVAPLRELAMGELKMCREGGNDSEAQEWADVLDMLDTLSFPPDEPLFLLRGQDVLAPSTVRFYTDRVDATGADLDVHHLVDHADLMQKWTPRKLPD